MAGYSVHPLPGVPRVRAGDDLGRIVRDALACAGLVLSSGDVLVLAQKIVSKAEGRQILLSDIVPSPRAIELGAQCAKDPRLVECVLAETDEIVRVKPGVLIVRHRLGLVLANAGIDQSNIDHADGEAALLLPLDPDASARALREDMRQHTGASPAVLVIDSLGRAWRTGTVGTAIGVAGIPSLHDLRGHPDLFGRELQTSELGLADEIAAAASLAMGQAGEATPIVLVRGLDLPPGDSTARHLVRPLNMDLFR